MQTFLSEFTFEDSASVLDNRRLQKQLLEGRQILNLIVNNNPKAAWFNHPATRMWHSYPVALTYYLQAVKNECVRRNINVEKNWTVIKTLFWQNGSKKIILPDWWKDKKEQKRLVYTHRARLYVKEHDNANSMYCNYYDGYSEYVTQAVKCCEGCLYYWPSHVR